MIVRTPTIWDAKYIGLIALALTSACSSGGAGVDPLNFATTQDAMDELGGLISDIQSSGFVDTTTAELPTSGSVAYQGYLAIAGTDDTVAPADDFLFAVGRLELTANFSGVGTIDGVADHFIDGSDAQMTGELVVEVNNIGPAGDFTGQVDGMIINSDGFEYTYQVPVDGGFLGPSVDYMGAVGGGDFTDLGTNVVTPFGLVFVTERE